jgi:DEAD/DEAH box helicase domain-containing protein
MDHVVVDVEIQKTIEETPGGWDSTHLLGVAVACVWEYSTQRMKVYGPDEVEALRQRLFAADRISGYNIFNFDFPVIWGIQKKHWLGNCTDITSDQACEIHDGVKKLLGPKTSDMLRRIWIAEGFNPDKWQPGMGGSKLDDIAGATIGVRKISDGASAPREYQKGRIQWVANYCADDVAIERDLTDFVDRYGYVIKDGKQLFLKR